MKVEEVAELKPIDRFIYWIKERHKIHFLRQCGRPKPWTDDEILQNYFFTNPYREHDKVTTWLRCNFRHKYRNDPKVFFGTFCFRWFNYIPTGKLLLRQSLLVDWDCERAVKILTQLASADEKVFTGAFNISNGGSTKPKINRVCEDYIQPVWEQKDELLEKIELCGSMEEAHKVMSHLPGFGGSGFMCYELVCDLRYTYLLKDATDKLTWSNPGPGAKRGLNRLKGRELKAPVSKELWAEESAALLTIARSRLPKLPTLEMREIEHSLCEFDKMERARLQDGHVKRRYAGT